MSVKRYLKTEFPNPEEYDGIKIQIVKYIM